MNKNVIAPAIAFEGAVAASAIAAAVIIKQSGKAKSRINTLKANRKQFDSKLFGIF